jgi:hypothetical protein
VGSTAFGCQAWGFGCLPFLGCLNHRVSWTTLDAVRGLKLRRRYAGIQPARFGAVEPSNGQNRDLNVKAKNQEPKAET